MANIEDIEGIGPVYAAKLAEAGIKTDAGLLKDGGTKAGRAKIAGASGISESTILEWVNRADLARVKGVGSEFADLLEAAGVDSPKELARRNAENLTAKMAELNEEKERVRRLPGADAVAGWIEDAKTLEKAVF